MFGNAESIDTIEQVALSAEAEIGRLRAVQIHAIRDLDVAQVRTADGSRTLVDWVAARFDVTHDTARHLVFAARAMTDHTLTDLVSGEIGFERAVAETRLLAEGATTDTVARSRGLDLAGVRRLAARHGRLTARTERDLFRSQHLVIQPNLDESAWRLHGQLAGFEGRIVEKAIHQRSDELSAADEGPIPTALRSAIALVSMCQDSLDPAGHGDRTSGREPVVTIMVDAALATPSRGEAGAAIVGGPAIGPNLLGEMLCRGRIEVNATAGDGSVRALGATTAALPARLRRHVLARDGACTVDGCSSRYRLEVHHITPRRRGGTHDARGLGTFCWYHHHVAIHGLGYTIDRDSPRHRRRLIPPDRDPPPGPAPP